MGEVLYLAADTAVPGFLAGSVTFGDKRSDGASVVFDQHGSKVSNLTTETTEVSEVSRAEFEAKLAATEARIEASLARSEGRLEGLAASIGAQQEKMTNAAELIKARIEAVEKINEKAQAGLEKKIDALPNIVWLLGAVASGSIAVITIVLAVLAFGGDRFDGGVQISGLSVEQAVEAKRIAEQSRQDVNSLIKRIDAVITRLETGTSK